MTTWKRTSVGLSTALLIGVNPAPAADTNQWPGTKEASPLLRSVACRPNSRGIWRTSTTWTSRPHEPAVAGSPQVPHRGRDRTLARWPQGEGIEKHIEDLKYTFSFAPDNRIMEHPVDSVAQEGGWTAVTGWMEGTFTEPMVLPDGKTIQPTGKAYRIPMATIGHWNKDGIMFEEFLFWDNGEFMEQIGVPQIGARAGAHTRKRLLCSVISN